MKRYLSMALFLTCIVTFVALTALLLRGDIAVSSRNTVLSVEAVKQSAAPTVLPTFQSVAQLKATMTAVVPSATPTPGKPLPTMIPIDAENVPLYPDAEKVEVTLSYDIGLGSTWTDYEAIASKEDVLRYYDDYLLSHGWILDREDHNSDGSIMGRKYLWKDKDSAIPVTLSIYISTTDSAYGPNKGKVFTHVSTARHPDPERVPVYPGAQQLTTNEWIEGAFAYRTIKYTVAARTSEVEKYYRELMPQLGVDTSGGSITDAEGLNFYRVTGGAEQVVAYVLEVTAREIGGGQTEVTLPLKYS